VLADLLLKVCVKEMYIYR